MAPRSTRGASVQFQPTTQPACNVARLCYVVSFQPMKSPEIRAARIAFWRRMSAIRFAKRVRLAMSRAKKRKP